jgi:hypothetical protein
LEVKQVTNNERRLARRGKRYGMLPKNRSMCYGSL